MTPEELNAIRERCEKATPGPLSYGGNWEYTHVFKRDDSILGLKPLGSFEKKEDAKFFIHAREDIPALLDYIKELEARISKKEEVHDDVWLGWKNRKGGEEK